MNETHAVNLPTWFWDNPKNPKTQILKTANQPFSIKLQKLRMITTCLVHNDGHPFVYANKRSSRHIRQEGWLNNQTVKLPKLQKRGHK